ncbi:MAG: extracellular solute-binding protein [Lachnospiraceae bacterium]
MDVKRYGSAVLLLTLTLMLTGCTSNQPKAQKELQPVKETVAHTDATTTDGKTIIHVILTNQWKGVISAEEEGAEYDSFLKYAADKFLAQYGRDDIEIQVTALPGEDINRTILEKRGSKDAIDILFGTTFCSADFAHKGWLLPLDDIVDEASQQDIPASIWNDCHIGDSLYFYPFLVMPNTLAYNTKLFRDAGLESYIGGKEDIVTWTVDEFDTILEQLHQNLPQGCAPLLMYAGDEQGDTHTMLLLRSRGTSMFNDKGIDLYNDEGIAGFQWIKDCADKGYFPKHAETMTMVENEKAFSRDEIAITVLNSVIYPIYVHDKDVRLANFPSVNGGMQTTFITAGTVFDNSDADRAQIAKDFVQFFSSDSELVYSSINGIPIRESVLTKEEKHIPFAKAYADTSNNIVTISNNLPNWESFRTYYYPALQALLRGDKTAEETAMYIQEKGNAAIMRGDTKSVLWK